jgi:hypothetical protein
MKPNPTKSDQIRPNQSEIDETDLRPLVWRGKLTRKRGVPSTMSKTSDQRSEEFLQLSGQFQLGMLTTESSHPVTANLSETARRDAGAGLGLLFEADGDVVFAITEGGETSFVIGTAWKGLEAGARVYFGGAESVEALRRFGAGWAPDCRAVLVPAPKTGFLLDAVTRAGLKMLLNALSTCTMARLGRVMGNYMIWVAPSNLKLVGRSTRYIQKLTGLGYAEANRLLFEVVEYVEPGMKADQAYPPVVGVAVMRARHRLGNPEAEKRSDLARLQSGLALNGPPWQTPRRAAFRERDSPPRNRLWQRVEGRNP